MSTIIRRFGKDGHRLKKPRLTNLGKWLKENRIANSPRLKLEQPKPKNPRYCFKHGEFKDGIKCPFCIRERNYQRMLLNNKKREKKTENPKEEKENMELLCSNCHRILHGEQSID